MALFTTALPPAEQWNNQEAFEAVFGFVPRVLAASLIAYWCGEFANAVVMSKMKIWTQGNLLWTRTIGSTVVGQFVDTIIVTFIVFFGQDLMMILNLMFTGYMVKVIYEAAATPITYLVVNTLKRVEGVDVYDEGVDFNPFHTTPDGKPEGPPGAGAS